MSDKNIHQIFRLKDKVLLPYDIISISVPKAFAEIDSLCVAFTNENNDKTVDVGVFCEVKAKTSGVISSLQGTRSYVNLTLRGIQKIKIIPKDESVFKSEVTPLVDLLPEQDKEKIKKEKLIEEVKFLLGGYFSEYRETSSLVNKLYLLDINMDIYSSMFISHIYALTKKDKLDILLSSTIYERLCLLKSILQRLSNEMNKTTKSIESVNKVVTTLDKSQPNQSDISKFIRTNKNNVETLISEVNQSKMHEEAKEIALEELSQIKSQKSLMMSEQQQWTLNYIKTLLSMPWEVFTKDEDSILKAEEILNRDHYGLSKVKERILEFLSVRKNNSHSKGSILCLNGPPGVGKTSLVKSIAEAMGRKYFRISLGGIRDESTIRGHRRTYIASMPGNIMQAIRKVQTANPVILLDEIDKLGYENTKGDVESALLEVLDPEQNSAFKDHYLNTYFDISKVLFICTSNNIEKISAPLKDRLEIIDLSGYSIREKIEIAKKYLIPKQIKLTAVNNFVNTIFSDEVISIIIEGYTLESGVRGLEKKIEAILRHLVKDKMMKLEKSISNQIKEIKDFVITKEFIEKVLGSAREKLNLSKRTNLPGVAIGLAYTQYGGTVILIEVSRSKSESLKIELTGNLKEIMKESAITALSWIKANIHHIDSDFKINEWSFHVHVPEAATPKDGPSAGITICCALVSSILNKPLRNDTAMTGELSLAGFVLPIGGVKEKILSGYSNGIKRFILSSKNRKDVEKDLIEENILKEIKIIYVDHVTQVIENMFPYIKYDKVKGFTQVNKF